MRRRKGMEEPMASTTLSLRPHRLVGVVRQSFSRNRRKPLPAKTEPERKLEPVQTNPVWGRAGHRPSDRQ